MAVLILGRELYGDLVIDTGSAARRALEEPERIEVADEGLFAVLREPEPEALRPAPVGDVVPLERGQRRHLRDDVFAKLVPAHAALGADAAVRAVGHGDPLERLLQVRLEPPLGDTRVDVVPRERRVEALVRQSAAVDAALSAAALRAVLLVAQFFQHVPLAVDHLAVLPAQTSLLDGLVE